MLFTEPAFFYYFLPLVLAAYFVLPRGARNALLLVSSLFFYAWGEGSYVAVMLTSILLNFAFGLVIDRSGTRSDKSRRLVLTAGVCANLLMLVMFKYSSFLGENVRLLLGPMALPALDRLPRLRMPIGISFFTFQAISYLVDVYRRDVAVSRNLIDYAMYKSLFPQLIAGPIVRYADVANQVKYRVETTERFASGVRRFIAGMGKKMIVANTAAFTADRIFSLESSALTPTLAWLGIICYTVQIYFDFSGYSDMAIGLGKMFGFEFLENFNDPYMANSITDFWRRWHISLSSWFRDYLYIPLGGNRCSPLRVYFNLMTVFVLCGLWHGASWNFLLWGTYHGLFLVAERLFLRRVLEAVPAVFLHGYALLVVVIGWVLFRTENLAAAGHFLGTMFGFGGRSGSSPLLAYDLSPKLIFALAAAVVLSTPLLPALGSRLNQRLGDGRPATASVMRAASRLASDGLLLLVLFASMSLIAGGSYNPFIYFRF